MEIFMIKSLTYYWYILQVYMYLNEFFCPYMMCINHKTIMIYMMCINYKTIMIYKHCDIQT